jgi:hypothetical protein
MIGLLMTIADSFLSLENPGQFLYFSSGFKRNPKMSTAENLDLINVIQYDRNSNRRFIYV